MQDGGKGLVSVDLEALERRGVQPWFDTPAVELFAESGAVTGVVVLKGGEHVPLKAPVVIPVCGDFEASRALRIKYFGHTDGSRIACTKDFTVLHGLSVLPGNTRYLTSVYVRHGRN